MRRFGVSVYTWGDNAKNLGRKEGDRPHSWPLALGVELEKVPTRSVVGVGETLLVQENKRVIGFGSSAKFSELKEEPGMTADFILDADIDQEFAIFLKEGGEIEVDFGQGEKRSIGANPDTKAVACNKADFFAVTTAAGGDKVFHLNKKGVRDGRYELSLNEPVTKAIQQRKAKVSKIRAAEKAAAVLLSDGTLLTWGSNRRGVVGHTRSELVIADHHFNAPQNPLELAGVKAKVRDFELSANVLVVHTEDNRVFFCGLENVFLLREVQLPKGSEAALVGCWEGTFVVVTKDNKIFSNADFHSSPTLVRRYDDLGLYRIDNAFFDGKKLSWLGGKYSNALAYAS